MLGPVWITLYFVFAFSVSFAALYTFGNLKKLQWYVILAVLSTWWLNSAVIFLMPSDVSGTFYRHCVNQTNADDCEKPMTYISVSALIVLWKIVYWYTQVMTWLILPVMQSFVDAAAFSYWGKFKAAVKENLIIYLSLGVVFGVLLAILIIRNTLGFSAIVGIAMAASNTWGLFCVVCLLGYGLVDVPRRLADKARKHVFLKNVYFKAAQTRHELDEADDDLKEAAKEILSIYEVVDETNDLHKNVLILKNKLPEKYIEYGRRGSLRTIEEATVTESFLVNLHRKLNVGLHNLGRTESEWSTFVIQANETEDILSGKFKCEADTENVFKNTWFQILFFWKKYCESFYYWILFVFTSILSLIIIWSEAFFFIKSPVISVTALVIHALGAQYQYVVIEMICLGTILYIFVCVFSTLFRIRVFNYFHLCPNHHSDAVSLVFSAVIVSRLAPALILNFLSINQLDGHVQGDVQETTAFTQIMGHMDVIPFVANGFMVFFPIVIVLVALASFFNVFTRLLCYDSQLTNDLITEGRDLIRAENRRTSTDSTPFSTRDRGGRNTSERGYNSRGNRDVEQQPLRRRSSDDQLLLNNDHNNEEGIFSKLSSFFNIGSNRVNDREEVDIGLLESESESADSSDNDERNMRIIDRYSSARSSYGEDDGDKKNIFSGDW